MLNQVINQFLILIGIAGISIMIIAGIIGTPVAICWWMTSGYSHQLESHHVSGKRLKELPYKFVKEMIKKKKQCNGFLLFCCICTGLDFALLFLFEHLGFVTLD